MRLSCEVSLICLRYSQFPPKSKRLCFLFGTVSLRTKRGAEYSGLHSWVSLSPSFPPLQQKHRECLAPRQQMMASHSSCLQAGNFQHKPICFEETTDFNRFGREAMKGQILFKPSKGDSDAEGANKALLLSFPSPPPSPSLR